jgi:hypothetical protein
MVVFMCIWSAVSVIVALLMLSRIENCCVDLRKIAKEMNERDRARKI